MVSGSEWHISLCGWRWAVKSSGQLSELWRWEVSAWGSRVSRCWSLRALAFNKEGLVAEFCCRTLHLLFVWKTPNYFSHGNLFCPARTEQYVLYRKKGLTNFSYGKIMKPANTIKKYHSCIASRYTERAKICLSASGQSQALVTVFFFFFLSFLFLFFPLLHTVLTGTQFSAWPVPLNRWYISQFYFLSIALALENV